MPPLPRPSPLPLYGLMPGPFGTLIKYLKYQYCFTPTISPVTWRTIKLVPCILSPRVICIPLFPARLVSPIKSWYSIRMVFKDSEIAGSSCPEIIDTVDEADRNDESSSTLGVARLLRCRYGRRKSARRRRKSAKSARRANGSCQTLIFRFSRLVPRLT